MFETPTVSVIVTAWNRAATVGRAIESVLAQTYQDFEIVLVDDASSDNLLEVVEDSNWPKLRLVRNSVNRGIAGAKNTGIEASKGQYIAFLDSDDEWLPDKLEAQLRMLQTSADNIPLSFTAFYIQRENKRRVARVPQKYGSWFESSLLGEMFSFGSTLLTHRSCFERVGLLDEKIRRMEDRDWLMRYFDCWNDLIMIQKPMVVIHNSGWPSPEIVRCYMDEIYGAYKERVARRGERYERAFRSGMELEIATIEYRNKEYTKALNRISKMLLRDPRYVRYFAARAIRKIVTQDKY